MWKGLVEAAEVGAIVLGLSTPPPSDAPTNGYDVAVAAVVVGGALVALGLFLDTESDDAGAQPSE